MHADPDVMDALVRRCAAGEIEAFLRQGDDCGWCRHPVRLKGRRWLSIPPTEADRSSSRARLCPTVWCSNRAAIGGRPAVPRVPPSTAPMPVIWCERALKGARGSTPPWPLACAAYDTGVVPPRAEWDPFNLRKLTPRQGDTAMTRSSTAARRRRPDPVDHFDRSRSQAGRQVPHPGLHLVGRIVPIGRSPKAAGHGCQSSSDLGRRGPMHLNAQPSLGHLVKQLPSRTRIDVGATDKITADMSSQRSASAFRSSPTGPRQCLGDPRHLRPFVARFRRPDPRSGRLEYLVPRSGRGLGRNLWDKSPGQRRSDGESACRRGSVRPRGAWWPSI